VPLMLSGDRIPSPWVTERNWRALTSRCRGDRQAECLRVALVNNMPDAALESTETQFLDLLTAAAGEIPVCVELYSLPEITRGERAQQHMSDLYSHVCDLTRGRFDALIITGAEPRQPDLRSEAYWQTLVDLLDWAEHNTVSTILSCLAAHASVLHSDGVARHLLSDKRFGVFDEKKVTQHPLMAGAPDVIRFPHSRWNELREDELVSAGYTVLTKSKEAGVGLFAKQKNRSLFIHVQGHPEYAAETLLKEYRRDIKRFLRRERETYPSLPHGYFSASATELLADFRRQAVSDPSESILVTFPDAVVTGTLQNGWHGAGAGIYRNWLQYVASKRVGAAQYSVMAASRGEVPGKRQPAP
jgi:homoserine O-succinyltransferase/O-acetyltransferase